MTLEFPHAAMLMRETVAEISSSTPSPGTPPPATPPPDAGKTGWTAGRVIALVLGSIASLIGVALLLGGLALIVAHSGARDSDGYYTTGTERLATTTYALTAEDIDLGKPGGRRHPEGRARPRAHQEPSDPGGRPVFVGIGPERDVDAYLRGVARAELDDLDPPQYRITPGRRAPPAALGSGSGSRRRRVRGARRFPGRSRVETGASSR